MDDVVDGSAEQIGEPAEGELRLGLDGARLEGAVPATPCVREERSPEGRLADARRAGEHERCGSARHRVEEGPDRRELVFATDGIGGGRNPAGGRSHPAPLIAASRRRTGGAARPGARSPRGSALPFLPRPNGSGGRGDRPARGRFLEHEVPACTLSRQPQGEEPASVSGPGHRSVGIVARLAPLALAAVGLGLCLRLAASLLVPEAAEVPWPVAVFLLVPALVLVVVGAAVAFDPRPLGIAARSPARPCCGSSSSEPSRSSAWSTAAWTRPSSAT